jgi:hypothetical protein
MTKLQRFATLAVAAIVVVSCAAGAGERTAARAKKKVLVELFTSQG